MRLTATNEPKLLEPVHALQTSRRRQYQQVDVEYNLAQKALWTYMKPLGVPCFNPTLIEEMYHNFEELKAHDGHTLHEEEWQPVQYAVIASRHPQVFNLGGDLALFINLIRARDRAALMHYASLCVKGLYMRLMNYDASTVTISLVQGDALGGGFELALSSHVIVAERGVRMGFPEIMFNLFPGMGAYSFLCRRVGMRQAEQIMISGNTYRSEDLEKMGVVDIIAPPGEGEKVVSEFIRKQSKRINGLRSIFECRRHIWPIQESELLSIAHLWVEAALRLEEPDLNIMSRLVRSQRSERDRFKHMPHGSRTLSALSA
jgi:DSF synthase